jgi:serine/threonine-protein kinase
MNAILERLRKALEGRYSVEGPLGEGGMALVFLARDVKHDRQVAVKVLRPELAASLGADRFLREIQITAKLQHPHILPLYDSGEADGLLFYVMPFVEGETLSEYIAREKQLSIEEAIRITREVAGALGHAHSYGLIHRDIKPENIMMSGGHAIVADFGIAKAVSDAGGGHMTQTGTTIGTPAYMSPEQAAGALDLDGRTDLYSLGCMLYEMLVGQIPFTGPTAQAIIARHTMDQVPPPSIMRQSITPELEDVIFCSMAKSPADRFRTAQEMIDALKTIETGGMPKLRTTQARQRQSTVMLAPPSPWRRVLVPAVSALGAVAVGIAVWQVFLVGGSGRPAAIDGGLDPKRIAVLYFQDLTPGGELSHVADGLTEGLIERLQTVRGLSIISRNGVAAFRDPTIPWDSIARALQVGSLVAGEVEQVGDEVRVTARLIDGQGSEIDRSTVRVTAGNLLAMQDSVVETASRFLRQRLGEEVRAQEARRATRSVEAWGLVQRALRVKKDAEARAAERERAAAVAALTESDSLLALAEAADPQWLDPKVERGWVAYQRAAVEEGPSERYWLEAAVRHAEDALAQASGDPRALELRGTVRYRQWSLELSTDPDLQRRLLESARADLEAAVQADPTLARARITLSYLFYALEDVPAALLAAQRGYEEDAYLENADDLLNRMFWGSLDLENFGQARRWCDEGSRRFPRDWRFVSCRLWLMATPAVEANAAEAWQLRARLDSLTQNPFLRTQADYLVGGVVGRAGLADSARALFLKAREQVRPEFDPELELISVEAYLRTLINDLDESIELLKRVGAANPEHDFRESAGTWWWRAIRNHPRFNEVVGGG